jgi:hypothetical protein
LIAGEAAAGENPYLMAARTGALNTVSFPHFLKAYRPLAAARNVRMFARQAKAFRRLIRRQTADRTSPADLQMSLALGQCLATIAYAQLVAENCARLDVPTALVAAIFHSLVSDLSGLALSLASIPHLDAATRVLARRIVAMPKTTCAEWDSVSARVAGQVYKVP